MIEIRCGGCDRLLAKAASVVQLQIKCPRCRTMNAQTATSCPNPERPRAPRNEDAYGSEKRTPPRTTRHLCPADH
ncbi:hypothetical protein BWR15_06135 [Pseudomonas sp. T]|nr:hypothetical protein BWR15_06135 [Pseudomonas sp. T]